MLRRNCRLKCVIAGKKEKEFALEEAISLSQRQNPFLMTKIPVYWCRTNGIQP